MASDSRNVLWVNQSKKIFALNSLDRIAEEICNGGAAVTKDMARVDDGENFRHVVQE